MLKNLIVFFVIACKAWLFGGVMYGQTNSSPHSIFYDLKHHSPQQLLDTALYFFRKNSMDTALACYKLLISTSARSADFERQKKAVVAHNQVAGIYYFRSDFRMAYEHLIKALLLAEKTNYTEFLPRIYLNIGTIYYRFKKYDFASEYYLKALGLAEPHSIQEMIALNNIGISELESGRIDSAFDYIRRALKISKQLDNQRIHVVFSSLASIYKKIEQYDSAYHYFRLSLEGAGKGAEIELVAENLSKLGKLFFEINQIDSARYYINLSNSVATDNHFLRILAKNHLTLSQIERSRGAYEQSLKYFEMHVDFLEQAFSIEVFGGINQLRQFYEFSKINEKVEQLAIEQKIKERTIHYQKIILQIIVVVLILLCIVMAIIFLQKKQMKTAQKILFEKNAKLMEHNINTYSKSLEKYKNSAQTDNMQSELLDKILALMEDTPTICDTEFSIDKLAELVSSNYTYVSQVINSVLKKNFRSLLNEYRIREAQRLLSSPDATKYTLEAIALQVGFKSRSAFREVFKKVTGVSPHFYLKSMQQQCENEIPVI